MFGGVSLSYLWNLYWRTMYTLGPGLFAGFAGKLLWQAMGEVFVCWMNQWWCSLFRVFLARVVTMLAPVFANWPQVGVIDIAPMIQWWLLVDYYLPLTEGIALMTALSSVVVAMRTWRFAKQFFPTLSS